MEIYSEVLALLASGWIYLPVGVIIGVIAGALPGFGDNPSAVLERPITVVLLIAIASIAAWQLFGLLSHYLHARRCMAARTTCPTTNS